jgi:hypothetical protein
MDSSAAHQPGTSHTGQTEPARFQSALDDARKIKETYVDPRIKFYVDHTKTPRNMFRLAGIAVILCSATLPALAAGNFSYKTLIVSTLSIAVAVLTGLGSFFHWERTWHGNSTTQVAIEQYCGKWELELAHARLILPPEERIKHVYLATDDLLSNVRSAMSAETEGFFNNLRFPQADRTSKE